MADRVGFRIVNHRGEIWSRCGPAGPCATAVHGLLGSGRGWRACLVALATGATLVAAGARAQATIMLDQGFGFADRSGDFEARFLWDLPAAGDDKAGPFTGNCGGGRQCWTVKSLESLAPDKNDPKRSMIVFPQHSPGQIAVDVGHGPNAATGTLGFFDILRPPGGKPIYVSANRIAHDQHSDYFTGVMKVPRADALSITIKGKHEGAFNPMQASFTNFSDKSLTGYYQPSYGTPRPGEIPDVGDKIPFGTVKPKEAAKRENLPKSNDERNPTDYLVVASGSATTQTTLGYLGTIGDDPTITELELTPLTEMLAPDGFVVPMLRDVSVDVDLYVFVDLLLWLGADATFTPLEEYAVSGGTSDLLPGFFVSTTPVSINPDGSFVGTPYSGLAFAAAGIDGHVVPSPSTLTLLAAAILGLVGRALGHATAVHRGRLLVDATQPPCPSRGRSRPPRPRLQGKGTSRATTGHRSSFLHPLRAWPWVEANPGPLAKWEGNRVVRGSGASNGRGFLGGRVNFPDGPSRFPRILQPQRSHPDPGLGTPFRRPAARPRVHPRSQP